jgi:hypothetical protein
VISIVRRDEKILHRRADRPTYARNPHLESKLEIVFHLLGPLIFLVIISVGFMRILGVPPERTLGFWKRLVAWPFRWLARRAQAAGRRALRALGRLMAGLLRATALVTSWPLRWSAWWLWEQLREAGAITLGRPFVPRRPPRVLPPRRCGRRP